MTSGKNRHSIASFSPDWASPAGDTVLDLLDERGWTQQQLADRLGYSLKHVNQLIKGKVPLSEDAAIRLHSVLGSTVGFWLNREAQYRERLATLEVNERQRSMVSWLELFPIKDLMDVGVLIKRRVDAKTKPALVGELLKFFGVASAEQWESLYAGKELIFFPSRVDQDESPSISVWLRMGERMVENLDAPPYNEIKARQALRTIGTLSFQSLTQTALRMRLLLQEAGIAIVFVPSWAKFKVTAAIRWLHSSLPMIQLSVLYEQDDLFLVNFIHEAAHILLNHKNKEYVFLQTSSRLDFSEVSQQKSYRRTTDFLSAPIKKINKNQKIQKKATTYSAVA